MQRSRRKFLTRLGVSAAVAAGGVSWWVAVSKRRSAHWVRTMIADARRSIQPAPFKPDPTRWSDQRITVSWLGHATVLINFYGIRILTDPAFGSRIGVSLGIGTAGPKRYIAPALRFKELPPIDVLLLSHAHMDHMDLPTLHHLRDKAFTVTAKVTRDVLADAGLKQPIELGWNERVSFRNTKGDLEIQAIEVKHWGERWPSHLDRGYNGYILRREGKALIFGGDTARTELFAALRGHGPYDLAMMPIGAYQPWIWHHCNPEQAVQMANEAGARYILPMHHQTFRLSEEPMHEPIERFQAALASEPERIALSQIGQSFVCPST